MNSKINSSINYSAERALSDLEAAFREVEAERAARLIASNALTDELGDVAHSLRARLIQGFEAIAALPANPFERDRQYRRAVDLFGVYEPIVGRMARELPTDQARLAALEAV